MKIKDFKDQIGELNVEEQKELSLLLERQEKGKRTQKAQEKFLDFVKFMWPHLSLIHI